jgi:uncharacterized protein YqcC (DUF446 family)
MVDLPAFAALADRIETELRSLGVWQAEVDRPTQEAFDNGGAFGMNTMAYTQWIQWVLVPPLREVAAGTLPVPPSSQVDVQAVREFDGWYEASVLNDLLMAVDDLIDASH